VDAWGGAWEAVEDVPCRGQRAPGLKLPGLRADPRRPSPRTGTSATALSGTRRPALSSSPLSRRALAPRASRHTRTITTARLPPRAEPTSRAVRRLGGHCIALHSTLRAAQMRLLTCKARCPHASQVAASQHRANHRTLLGDSAGLLRKEARGAPGRARCWTWRWARRRHVRRLADSVW
jgi:hypothetical protein